MAYNGAKILRGIGNVSYFTEYHLFTASVQVFLEKRTILSFLKEEKTKGTPREKGDDELRN